MAQELTITPFEESDWPEIWPILQAVFAEGESYPCPRDIDEAGARAYWLGPTSRVYAARVRADGPVAGSFYIRPDQGGPGDHVCNCGYVVAPGARGLGLATAMCRWSQDEAGRLGFSGMKFNLVVATNAPAVRAWEKAGMRIIGTTPKAFRSPAHGLVDAHIMYRAL